MLLAAQHAPEDYAQTVQPFLQQNCLACHSTAAKIADVNVEALIEGAVADDVDLWEMVARKIRTGEIGREGSVRAYPEVGVNDPHHPMTHHRNLPEMIEKVTKINTYHTELFSYFLDKMAATEDGDGSLLDQLS